MADLEHVLNFDPIIKVTHLKSECGSWKVLRTTIQTKVYDPVKRQILIYEYTIGHLIEYVETHIDLSIITEKISQEIKTFCPDRTKQKIYFFNNVYDEEGNEMPLFEGILYYGDASPIGDINRKNIRSFSGRINEHMKDLVYFGEIENSFNYDFIQSLHFIGDDMNEFLTLMTDPNTPEIDYRDDGESKILKPKDYAMLMLCRDFPKHLSFIQQIKDLALKHYMLEVYASFMRYIQSSEMAGKCENCDSFFNFRVGKKFCSERCRRAVANRKQYKKNQKGTE